MLFGRAGAGQSLKLAERGICRAECCAASPAAVNVAADSISETVQLAPVNRSGATLAFSWCDLPQICRGKEAG